MSEIISLAEALALRADYKRTIDDFRSRMQSAAVRLEDEQEAEGENAQTLLDLLRGAIIHLAEITAQINHTNATTRIAPLDCTLSAALALRGQFDGEIKAYRNAIEASKADRWHGRRTTREELKWVIAFNANHLRAEIDRISRARRELDAVIQKTNWETPLDTSEALPTA